MWFIRKGNAFLGKMKEKDYLIVGLGLCGAWLAYFLRENGSTVDVYDGQTQLSASEVSGGIINPVTGRRVVTTWLADELIPWLSNTMSRIGISANRKFISPKTTLSFPGSLQMKLAYEKRVEEENRFISSISNEEEIMRYFNTTYLPYSINSTFIVHAKQFITYVKELLLHNHSFFSKNIDESILELKDEAIVYDSVKYKKIIYANGYAAMNSIYWKNLPFVPNKGQALIVEIPHLPDTAMYKFGMLTLVPIDQGMWWVGSSNELRFDNDLPGQAFLSEAVITLKAILKQPFTIKKHLSAIRPATVERRPFVGVHPLYKQIAILNGMGSKGCSLAPWFAKQLTHLLKENIPIDKDADVIRFSKLLMR